MYAIAHTKQNFEEVIEIETFLLRRLVGGVRQYTVYSAPKLSIITNL